MLDGSELRFDGRVALVTGAGSGIGEAIALALANLGADVGALDRDAATAQRSAERIRALGRRAEVCVADVRDSPCLSASPLRRRSFPSAAVPSSFVSSGFSQNS